MSSQIPNKKGYPAKHLEEDLNLEEVIHFIDIFPS